MTAIDWRSPRSRLGTAWEPLGNRLRIACESLANRLETAKTRPGRIHPRTGSEQRKTPRNTSKYIEMHLNRLEHIHAHLNDHLRQPIEKNWIHFLTIWIHSRRWWITQLDRWGGLIWLIRLILVSIYTQRSLHSKRTGWFSSVAPWWAAEFRC